jgi:succinyl-diaminopimelate desuccinylase
VDGEQASLEVNIRYPVTLNGAEIIEQLKKAALPFGFDFVDVRDSPPYLKQKDSFLVQTLRQVFTDVTGIEAEPQTIGGGTYARATKNCVAFGALFPGEPHLAHQSDEYVTIDSLLKNTEIFALAIYRLADGDDPAGN